jgi:hypothetical protein
MHADTLARLNLSNLRFPARSRRVNYFTRQYGRVPSAECFKNLAFTVLAQFFPEGIDNQQNAHYFKKDGTGPGDERD